MNLKIRNQYFKINSNEKNFKVLILNLVSLLIRFYKNQLTIVVTKISAIEIKKS